MAWKLLSKLHEALTAQPSRAACGGEVTLTACVLEGVDPAGPKVSRGEEFMLETRGDSVAVTGRKGLVGFIPAPEASRIAGLLRQGASVGCRVVQDGKGSDLVRVRIHIRI